MRLLQVGTGQHTQIFLEIS